MGLTFLTPTNSFVRFDGALPENHCIFGQQQYCLPVLEDSDVQFQFVVQTDTVEEADALCTLGESGLSIGLVRDCVQEGFDVEFAESPQRFRLSDFQVLYTWSHGLTGAIVEYSLMECFYIRIEIGAESACSNCFQRVGNGCFTSVIEYGNSENFAGFNYCNSGAVEGDESADCEPYIISFVNQTTLTIPYTTALQNRFGQVPTVQTWIYDTGGQLVNMGILATFDNMPPTQLYFDFGGLASGVIVIR